MANRLATEYVKTYLELTEAEMLKLLRTITKHVAEVEVRVFENGSQEIALNGASGDKLALTFERNAGLYVCTGTFRTTNHHLANAMRKFVAAHRGSAVVRRIYAGFEMVYYYEQGKVAKIVELKAGKETIVYEYKNTRSRLEQLFRKREAEKEISAIRYTIDELLDKRNAKRHDEGVIALIDNRLRELSHRLFVLEG